MSDRLFQLLCERMAGEQVGLDEPVTIAELHKRLLPYHACRDVFQFATKAEYDLEILRLLANKNRIEVPEAALAEAVLAETRQPEPGLGFLQRFAASEIRLKKPAGSVGLEVEAEVKPAGSLEPASAPRAAPESDPRAAGCRSCGASLPTIEGVRYCPACGTDQVIPTCTGCSAELGEDWRYCALCGILVGPET